jgi:hypothetical protein
MTNMQRTKGQAGEREAAALLAKITGHEVKRRVRQHDGDSDLDFPGWSVEIKRHAEAPPHSITTWWRQAVAQAERAGLPPLLLYRADRRPWRAAWAPTGNTLIVVEADISAWWALVGRGLPTHHPEADRASCVDLVGRSSIVDERAW